MPLKAGALLVAVLAATLGVAPATPGVAAAPLGCTSGRTTLTADAELDPTCTYGGFDIHTSGVTLDCRGATIAGAAGRGIEISAPTTTALHDVHARNCRIQGFLNGVRVTRDGFRDLAPGVEYDHAFADVSVEDSTVTGARGVGIFVDGYVTGVTVRGNVVRGNGSSGIYLDGGSRDNVVESNEVLDNGFVENGPEGTLTTIGGLTVRYWGPGREGLSLDGSRTNHVVGNHFRGNSAGGIFVYKNCGEYHLSRPDRWFDRRTPSDGNIIEANTFDGGLHGVWVASRMGENTAPMECSDPAYLEAPLERVVLDHAAHNVVRSNTFHDVTYGVHVEDDDTIVQGNTFTGSDPGQWAVIVGTRLRTTLLDHPVSGTRLVGNTSTIVGNASPYRWVHGERDTMVAGNTALGREVGICQAPEVPHNPMIMVIAFAVENPGDPPTPAPDLTVPTLGAQPACADVVADSTTTTGATTPSTSAGSATPVAAVATFAG